MNTDKHVLLRSHGEPDSWVPDVPWLQPSRLFYAVRPGFLKTAWEPRREAVELLISHFQVQALGLSFEWESILHGSTAFQREIKYGDKQAIKITDAFARQREASGYLEKTEILYGAFQCSCVYFTSCTYKCGASSRNMWICAANLVGIELELPKGPYHSKWTSWICVTEGWWQQACVILQQSAVALIALLCDKCTRSPRKSIQRLTPSKQVIYSFPLTKSSKSPTFK